MKNTTVKRISAIICIFAAVLLLCGCSSEKSEKTSDLAPYKCDLVLYDLNKYQHNILVSYNGNEVYKAAKDSFYITNEEDGTVISHVNGDETTYDLMIRFAVKSDDVYEKIDAFERFRDEFLEGDNAVLRAYGDLKYDVADYLKEYAAEKID